MNKSNRRNRVAQARDDRPYSGHSYGANWTKQRRKCLERDGRDCRVCGKEESKIGREPAVHHITPRANFNESEWAEYNSLSNLITLCHSCHGAYEGKYTDCTPEEAGLYAVHEDGSFDEFMRK